MKLRHTGEFKRDYKRLKKGPLAAVIGTELGHAVSLLQSRQPMPANYFDHPLSGKFRDCRDCHIRGDLVLIYRWEANGDVLCLVRIGSHSELGI